VAIPEAGVGEDILDYLVGPDEQWLIRAGFPVPYLKIGIFSAPGQTSFAVRFHTRLSAVTFHTRLSSVFAGPIAQGEDCLHG
jgi:hypothetical protein